MQNLENKKVSLPSSPDPNLGMFQGPKLFINLVFCPPEYKSYSLSCMIDSGCLLNLAKGSTIPLFYWEKSVDHDSTIEGIPVSLIGKIADFPI